MSVTHFLPLALFVLVSTITPGGATTLATASGAHFGYRRSLPLMTGIAAGLASMAASAAAGLGTLILALPSLQLVMKLVGSVYLLWLAWKISRSGPPHLNAKVAKPTRFLGAVWLLWHNPKGWAMTLGAAASFAALTGNPLQLGVLLGGFFAVGALLSLSLWCLAGLVLARLLRTDAQWRILNSGLGVMLAASIAPMWFE
ncbi:LysE family translocator [Lichenicola cladoniae]|uniref:LysE family translocator n=1 Tax=Lichenicola cladoniae TaxID=1484109 RepID=A0A6M8HPV4_9PROT|nr:LysE family translocator [Lichenicola cladoniae]NPD66416.1 LysE family translocator [Acetobacteraceae bacterium]QKE90346.1 LysE family translocator [Lichenicola cladoniae]